LSNGIITSDEDFKYIQHISYRCRYTKSRKASQTSLKIYGIDTESYSNGNCFLICTSLGDSYTLSDVPRCFFSRRYRGCNFVAYNLKYDEGALLQFLPLQNLRELRERGRTVFSDYIITIIPRKMVSIRKGSHTVHFYDMYNFYLGSLDYNAKLYLGETKDDMETKTFSEEFVSDNYDRIVSYCIKDAILCEKLGNLLIKKLESFGIYPRKLYSIAYVSYQYFSTKCNYVTVKRFWDEDKKLLDFALQSYNGGKFEVTTKGMDHYYEYDIVSAYPYEIMKLVDITNARIIWNKSYRKFSDYGFLKVRMKIPMKTFSPVAVKKGTLNCYPAGYIEKVITKTEYEYLIRYNTDITIIEAVWIVCDKKVFPYKKEILNMVAKKQEAKEKGNKLDYHTLKILLNSLYGKFVQLIDQKGYKQASTCWNPIYASVITANVRTRVSEYQQKYREIVAVHTDSIISTKKLDIENKVELGNMIYECDGAGVILGSGIYQIGEKVRFRGFNLSKNLFDLLESKTKSISMESIRPYTWREVIFHNWEKSKINCFTNIEKRLKIDFDCKRLWIDDWHSFREVKEHKVSSLPLFCTRLGV